MINEYKTVKRLLACFVIVTCLFACDSPEKQDNIATTTGTTISKKDSVVQPDFIDTTKSTDTAGKKKVEMKPAETKADPPIYTLYSNETFKNVSVKKTAEGKFQASGKGRVFEGQFGWAVEDGQKELISGYSMLDAGPPEFGKFSFDFTVKKMRANSTLYLLLFENSAKDGSRQHVLRIKLN